MARSHKPSPSREQLEFKFARRGRPPTGKALSDAKRKRAQRARDRRQGKKELTVPLPEPLFAWVSDSAKRKGQSRSQVLVDCILLAQRLAPNRPSTKRSKVLRDMSR
jgi:hypothetical protein